MGEARAAAAAGKGDKTEEGAGTVMVLGSGLLLLILCAAVLILLQTAVAASRAATAADLAALAAADTVRELRSGEPCVVAAEVAGRNGAVLAACTVEAGEQTVQVETRVPIPLLPQPATGHARAGPPP
ncbi:Rv3654c family TadE-like protein [Arthrobacter sp. 08Y14]|uniref:Rv3654c family TadE-like protein n=1 Tax=Arthrobacter sp. 08Y14 TaxID=2058885 RepID=UPI0021584C21|nr:Rv3654c family TadE-like protein [Arthrobacter sp. 08Y14]